MLSMVVLKNITMYIKPALELPNGSKVLLLTIKNAEAIIFSFCVPSLSDIRQLVWARVLSSSLFL